jgi:hypothetical protein
MKFFSELVGVLLLYTFEESAVEIRKNNRFNGSFESTSFSFSVA